MEMIDVDFCKLYDDVVEPKYATEKSSGMDVRAYLPKDRFPDGIVLIQSGTTYIIPTGFKVAIPDGYEMQVRPRSGQSAKTKIRIANAPGTVDGDYRGEVGIIVDNISQTDHDEQILHGDKIAQIVFCPIVQAKLNNKKELDKTERGEGGFGHTGKN